MNTQLFTSTHVSSVDHLLEHSMEYDQHKVDFVKATSTLRFDQTSRLVVPAEMFSLSTSLTPLQPTDWAWRQLFAKLGSTVFGSGTNKVLPFDYLLALKPELRAYVLNEHLGRTHGEWMLRAYDDTCRAILSNSYACINNTPLLEILQQVTGTTDQPCAITKTSEVTPDTLNLRIIWKTVQTKPDKGGNDGWGFGTYIGNGEIGNRKLRAFPLIQRHSCQNSIVLKHDMGGLELIHRGSPSTKFVMLKATLLEILPFAAELLDKMIQADAQALPDFTDVLKGLGKQYGWSDEISTAVALGTEGRETRAGLVNGISFAAHQIVDPDARADMEILSGTMLVAKDSVFHSAAFAGRDI